MEANNKNTECCTWWDRMAGLLGVQRLEDFKFYTLLSVDSIPPVQPIVEINSDGDREPVL